MGDAAEETAVSGRVCFSHQWIGMRVMNHDDSQHHVRGVLPTIPLKPTLKGIQEGRDELYEKALQLLTAGE